MSRNKIFESLLALSCMVLAGCGQPTEKFNLPPGIADHPQKLQPFFTYMVDNAIVSDMSIADLHFVPHTTELNSLGTLRLARMAQLVEAYGGLVRYATTIQDEEMVSERIAHVRDFLAAAGADMDRIDVAVAMPGSHHTSAQEAVAGKQKGWATEFENTAE